MAKDRVLNQPMPEQDKPVLNSEQQNIVEWLKKVRFQKQLFGGVSEQDVWKKIDELGTAPLEERMGDGQEQEKCSSCRCDQSPETGTQYKRRL